MTFIGKLARAALSASVLVLIAAGCGGPSTTYYGAGTVPAGRFTSATLRWVVSGSRAAGTLTISQSSPPLLDLPAGSYGVVATVSGPVSDESYRGMLTMGRKTYAMTGSTQSASSAAIPVLVLTVSLDHDTSIPLYLHPDVPGTYSGTVVAPRIGITLTWDRTGATATGDLTVGAHPAGTFPLPAGWYPTTLQFAGNDLEGTIEDGAKSLHARGSVPPQDVVLTVSLAGGPVTLTFRSVGSQSYTGYAG